MSKFSLFSLTNLICDNNHIESYNDLPYSESINIKDLSSGHGEVRDSAGRKRLTASTQIRIDADLAKSFKTFSDFYRCQSDINKTDLLFRLSNFCSELNTIDQQQA
ncbi:hypothetical protein [Photobacterium carnosum]|uniref:hypothetical protein n=1 Tax=Photobacterium carnosum TaxID=2023717 RepID=UPI002491A196|nr:hypothetical protein [Photobacterium carnosum]